ncbi:MAG: hypothetical protein JXA67_13030, partial [Micromonosporaceae bacterium]|nr:hypothetical protein [Micromonosporaceae bacterium]
MSRAECLRSSRTGWRIGAIVAGAAVLATTALTMVSRDDASAATGCGSGTYQAEAALSGSTWTAKNGGSTVYTGTDMRAAMQAAVNSLTA